MSHEQNLENRLSSIECRIRDLSQQISGNGKAGFSERLILVEQKITQLEKMDEKLDRLMGAYRFAVGAVSVAVAVINAAFLIAMKVWGT